MKHITFTATPPHRPLNTLSAIPWLPDIFYNDPTPSTTQYIVSYTVITWHLLQRPHPIDHSIHCQLYRDYLTSFTTTSPHRPLNTLSAIPWLPDIFYNDSTPSTTQYIVSYTVITWHLLQRPHPIDHSIHCQLYRDYLTSLTTTPPHRPLNTLSAIPWLPDIFYNDLTPSTTQYIVSYTVITWHLLQRPHPHRPLNTLSAIPWLPDIFYNDPTPSTTQYIVSYTVITWHLLQPLYPIVHSIHCQLYRDYLTSFTTNPHYRPLNTLSAIPWLPDIFYNDPTPSTTQYIVSYTVITWHISQRPHPIDHSIHCQLYRDYLTYFTTTPPHWPLNTLSAIPWLLDIFYNDPTPSTTQYIVSYTVITWHLLQRPHPYRPLNTLSAISWIPDIFNSDPTPSTTQYIVSYTVITWHLLQRPHTIDHSIHCQLYRDYLTSFTTTPPYRPLNTLSAIPWLPDIFYNDPTPSTTQYIVSYTVIIWHLLQRPHPHRPLNTLSSIPWLPDIFYNDPTPSTTQYIVSYSVITWHILQRPHPIDHSIHCQLYRDYLTSFTTTPHYRPLNTLSAIPWLPDIFYNDPTLSTTQYIVSYTVITWHLLQRPHPYRPLNTLSAISWIPDIFNSDPTPSTTQYIVSYTVITWHLLQRPHTIDHSIHCQLYRDYLTSFTTTPPYRPLNTLSAIPWLPDIFYNDPTPSTTQYIVSYTVIIWHLLQRPHPHRPLNTLSSIPWLPDIFYNDPTPSTTQYIVSYSVITWHILQRPHPIDHSIHCQLYRDYLTSFTTTPHHRPLNTLSAIPWLPDIFNNDPTPSTTQYIVSYTMITWHIVVSDRYIEMTDEKSQVRSRSSGTLNVKGLESQIKKSGQGQKHL